MLRRFTSLCLLLLMCTLPVRAQTLAHPGWRGNGIAAQAWWKHAGFVRIGLDITFAEAARSLDAMAEAGVDSMILPDLQPPADAAMPYNTRFGTEEDLDALLREASARRMHVLVTMPLARLSAGDAEVRFWMSRGIAGLDVGTVSAGDLAVLRGVRSAMARFPGERILIARTAQQAATARADARRDPITLHVLSGDAAGQRQPSAIDIDDMASLAGWPADAAPIFRADLLATAEDRNRIHTVLMQRASHNARIVRRR